MSIDTFPVYETFMLHFVEILLHVHPCINRRSMQHFVQYDSHRPDVTFLRVLALFVRLRRHVFWWANIVVTLWFVRNTLFETIPKINKTQLIFKLTSIILKFLSSKDQIVRFNVSMNNLQAFYHSIGLKHLFKKIKSFILFDTIWSITNIIS